MNLTSVKPRFLPAHWTPSHADWLKLRSSTLPTSVTRPTRNGLPPGAGWLGQPGSGAAATGWVPAAGLGLGTTLAAGLAAGLAAADGLATGLAAGAAAGLAAGLAGAAAVVGFGAAVGAA